MLTSLISREHALVLLLWKISKHSIWSWSKVQGPRIFLENTGTMPASPIHQIRYDPILLSLASYITICIFLLQERTSYPDNMLAVLVYHYQLMYALKIGGSGRSKISQRIVERTKAAVIMYTGIYWGRWTEELWNERKLSHWWWCNSSNL